MPRQFPTWAGAPFARVGRQRAKIAGPRWGVLQRRNRRWWRSSSGYLAQRLCRYRAAGPPPICPVFPIRSDPSDEWLRRCRPGEVPAHGGPRSRHTEIAARSRRLGARKMALLVTGEPSTEQPNEHSHVDDTVVQEGKQERPLTSFLGGSGSK